MVIELTIIVKFGHNNYFSIIIIIIVVNYDH